MSQYDPALEDLSCLCREQTTWLMDRVLAYARSTGYARYASTLAEAWRLSIEGFNEAMAATAKRSNTVQELSAEEDPALNPGTAFGLLEARRHRERGISLEMFLGLTKYYRESYRDLVRTSAPSTHVDIWLRFVDLFFDRFEIGFCADWAGEYDGAVNTALLQRANRHMTNEKNKYLTIFEGLHTPVVVFDPQGRVTAANRTARQLEAHDEAAAVFYAERCELPAFAWLAPQVAIFTAGEDDERTYELGAPDRGHFHVWMRRIPDVSGKFAGTIVSLEGADSVSPIFTGS